MGRYEDKLKAYKKALRRQGQRQSSGLPGLPDLRQGQLLGRRNFWYVHGVHNGKAYTRGPYDSEAEARSAAHSMFFGEDMWTVEELPSRDLNRAKAMLRNINLNKGSTLDIAMQDHYSKRSPRGG